MQYVISHEAVDPARIYLTGLSMGGYGTWDLAARQPERFAAILPICGGGDEATAPRLAKLPIWCFHGDADTVVPVERSRTMIAAVRAAGGSPKYSELPGVGHDSWTPAYRDPAVLDWLFAKRA
jgi:predicted peptidase